MVGDGRLKSEIFILNFNLTLLVARRLSKLDILLYTHK